MSSTLCVQEGGFGLPAVQSPLFQAARRGREFDTPGVDAGWAVHVSQITFISTCLPVSLSVRCRHRKTRSTLTLNSREHLKFCID